MEDKKFLDENNIVLTDEEREQGYVVVATKVHPLAADQLRKMCEKKGFRMYRLLQQIIGTLVKMMGEQYIMEDNSHLYKLMEIFYAELNDFAHRYNIADPTAKTEITDALYFLGDHKHSKGRQSVLVTPAQKGVNGIPFPANENWNVMQQLDFVIQNLDTMMYKKMRRLCSDIGCNSIYELLHRLADDALQQDTLVDEIREMFADNDRSEYGNKPVKQPYKRKNRRNIEKIKFNDEDKKLADLEAQNWKPFGAEW